MKRWLCLIFCLLSLVGHAAPPLLISLGGGLFDLNHSDQSGLFQIEAKFAKYWWQVLRPQVGAMTAGFNSCFLYGGIGADLYLKSHIVCTPSFCPGWYMQGSSKDLGYPLEFRSAVALAYEWDNCVRLGGEFYHISNANLGTLNSGANCLVFFVAFPVGCSSR